MYLPSSFLFLCKVLACVFWWASHMLVHTTGLQQQIPGMLSESILRCSRGPVPISYLKAPLWEKLSRCSSGPVRTAYLWAAPNHWCTTEASRTISPVPYSTCRLHANVALQPSHRKQSTVASDTIGIWRRLFGNK